jgi:hypothetical protein
VNFFCVQNKHATILVKCMLCTKIKKSDIEENL